MFNNNNYEKMSDEETYKLTEQINRFYNSRYSQRSELPDSKTLERTLNFELAQIVGGLTEIKTPVGWIDVLTDDFIIEGKKASSYKHAIGQLMCYSYYINRPFKGVALFGKLHSETLNICEYLNIHVFNYNFNALRWYLEF